MVNCFTLMTAGPAGTEFGHEMLARNRRLYHRARALGGTRYPIESVAFTKDDWADHYGDRRPQLQELKQRVDPARILTPGPNIY